ncbi:DUF5667 domain-containing protein [Actinocatenispora rupis]|uniref:DUF5667 domain-containing protein n=1 Tax=Actinocatenispora rupis TaxID=519421 RepID=A0A8J3J8H9_9ACTN|nr:DUF5667 domain-containing protein [Actinocatenispora rupis]GID13651.1 hypothetical protein Aru02nite_45400 [Actinocatenispora rupis]
MNIFLRRRAERFAVLAEKHGTAPEGGPSGHHRSGHHTPDTDDALAHLVCLGQRISAERTAFEAGTGIDPEFRANLRDRLMADAALHGIGDARHDAEPDPTAPRPTHHAAPPNRRPKLRLVVVGGVVAGALGISGVAAASTSAVPGDPLYDVKRSTERAQIALAGSDLNSGELYLQFARTRAGEAGSVKGDPHSLAGVLDDMDRQTRQGTKLLDSTAVSRRDAASLDAVTTFAGNQRPDVVSLLSGLSGDSRTRALRSLALVDEVQQRATNLRRLLLCTAGKAVDADALGPIPQTCSALPGGSAPGPAGSGEGRASRSERPSHAPTPSGTPSGRPSPSPSSSGPLSGVPGVPLPTGSGSASPSPSSGSGGGGLFGTIGKILGGLL